MGIIGIPTVLVGLNILATDPKQANHGFGWALTTIGAACVIGGIIGVLAIWYFNREPGVQFEVREHGLDFPIYDLDRTGQPFRTLEVTSKGYLANGSSRKVMVQDMRVRFFRRQCMRWREVSIADPIVLKGGILSARIDPKFHPVEVEGDSRSDWVREIVAYFPIPDDWSLELLRDGRYRFAVDVVPTGKRSATQTTFEIELKQAVADGLAAHDRYVNSSSYREKSK